MFQSLKGGGFGRNLVRVEFYKIGAEVTYNGGGSHDGHLLHLIFAPPPYFPNQNNPAHKS